MIPSPKQKDESQTAYAIRIVREEEREACAAIFDRDDWPVGNGDLRAAAISPRVAALAIRNRKLQDAATYPPFKAIQMSYTVVGDAE